MITMDSFRIRTRYFLLLAGVVLLPAGCSDLTGKVNGTVYLDDQPVKITSLQRGTVMFRPVAGGATCTGLIGESGEYSISTGSASKLVPGEYLVSVQVLESIPPKGGNDAPTGKPITPAVYADPLTSDLSLVVKSGVNQYDIKLDSSAGPAVLPTPEEPEDSTDDSPVEEATVEEATEEEVTEEEVTEEEATGADEVAPEKVESEPKADKAEQTESVEAGDSEGEGEDNAS